MHSLPCRTDILIETKYKVRRLVLVGDALYPPSWFPVVKECTHTYQLPLCIHRHSTASVSKSV